MAKTKISDVIVPDVFNPYIIERTPELSTLIQSGIVQNTPELDTLALSGGRLLNMPFWEDLSGADEVLSDSLSLSPANISAKQDIAVLYMRGKAWSVNDLAKKLSGDDPMAEIANLVIGYWERRRQALLVSTLTGIFKASSMAVNLLDVTSASGYQDDIINADNLVDTAQKLGDNKSNLTGYLMHSATEAVLVKQQLIEYLPDADGRPTLPYYMGKRVIVNDNVPNDNGVYFTYIFGQGAFGFGQGSAPVPTELDRDSLAGDDILINRAHFLLHPRGVKWNATSINGSSPTNAEVEIGTNWERVYDQKNVRIVALKHKLVTANSSAS
jgi:hypothetical protein